ncbi:MAG: zinc-ribbon domain-containing protein [Chloroflexi bacterium]|nr:zinc-ribbon domain-containing protein [Chloroflexota bacterium]
MAEPVRMDELIMCPRCGESNPKTSRHCSTCGASLMGAQAAPAKPVKKVKLVERLKKKA